MDLSDDDLKKYVPLAIVELESELLKSLETSDQQKHRRAKRTLLKKKLIIAKLLILKALLAGAGAGAGAGKLKGGGYGYAPSVPSKYGPPQVSKRLLEIFKLMEIMIFF